MQYTLGKDKDARSGVLVQSLASELRAHTASQKFRVSWSYDHTRSE